MNACTEVGDVVIDFGVDVAVATFATVVTVTTASAVKPHFKLVRTVFCQFFTLLEEYLCYVSVLTVVCRVAVPGRDVEAVLHIVLLACLRKELGNVCRTAVFISRIRNAVGSCCCRPEAETIVVLHHGDTTVHTRSLHRSHPLFGIGLCQGRILGFGFVTEAPFQTRKGVHTVVEEGVELRFIPQNLAFTGNGMTRRRCIVGVGQVVILSKPNCWQCQTKK